MNTNQSGKLLFISHEASRSGAPIVLLHLLKWIKANTDQQFDILLLADGPLRSEFETLGQTYIADDIYNPWSLGNRIKKKLFNIKADAASLVCKKLSRNHYRLVYGNTIASLPWLREFKNKYRRKTVCCVHELSFALSSCFEPDYLKANLSQVDQIIAVSNAVKQNLIDSYQINDSQLDLQYEFIDTDIQIPETPKTINTFIIGAGGTPEWRKGTDLVVPLALKLQEKYPELPFEVNWLGADESNGYVNAIMYDARKCGIVKKIRFLPATDKPLETMSSFDVFVLLSREDPFPLIALEAAFLRKPVLAFNDSGGIPELLAQGAGLLAPYLDINILSDNIYQLYKNKELYNNLSLKAHDLIVTQYNSNKVSPRIYKLITQLLR